MVDIISVLQEISAKVTPNDLAKVIFDFSTIDWSNIFKDIETLNLQKEIVTIEDILKIIGIWVPGVAQAEADLEAAIFVVSIILKIIQLGPKGPHLSILPGPPLVVQNDSPFKEIKF